MRNLAIAYIAFVVIAIAVWIAIIPTEDQLTQRQAEAKFGNVVRSLQSEIITRYGTVDRAGNLSNMIYTYHEANITSWEISENRTQMTIYFVVTSTIRIKKHGLTIKEYPGPNQTKSIVARLENDAWRLDMKSSRDIS